MGQAWHMHVPAPLRAAVGLVATAADEARRLPDRALELPMLAISTALQASVRAQQRYACLTARGEALLNRTHPTDEPPAWATFDDPLPGGAGSAQSRFDAVDGESLPGDRAADTARLVGELVGLDKPAGTDADSAPAQPAPKSQPVTRTQPRKPPAKKTAAKSTSKTTGKSTAKQAERKPSASARRTNSSGSDAS